MIKETTVKLNEIEIDATGGTNTIVREYKVKRTNRALMLYEDIFKRSLDEISGTLTDMYRVFYCILKANNPTFKYTFDEFVDNVSDENPQAFADYQAYLIKLASEGLNDIVPDKKKAVRKPK